MSRSEKEMRDDTVALLFALAAMLSLAALLICLG